MTKTPIRRQPRGFGGSLGPDAIIKNLTNNTPELRESNIHSKVQSQRAEWNADYPYRIHKPFTKEKLLEEHESKVYTEKDLNEVKITNPALVGLKKHFIAFYKHWSLHITTMPDGKREFSFNVWAGNVSSWHPRQCRNNILKYHSEETYREWKRLVMSQWEEASTWLIQEARKSLRGFRAWSVTTCDSSERLMKNCPRVEVRDHVAFLYL